ncbi:indolepyruvate ferredoxin oxidoreductase family protein [Phenylobacterium sp.]|uniref:indolepyruvate ferredoxin oxidoreductase family protein n=1 Tax=Phenylobacterium sp. TaxID=1871053 RepID=UPI0035AFF7D4
MSSSPPPAPQLDDRYDLNQPRVLLNGMQAIVRLLLEQHQRDRSAGISTGGFVSGYRGSPLGRLDAELWAAGSQLATRDIHFQPGVNEELAATAIWGAQQTGLVGAARVDGVFGLWYGKGPGVDRSGDVFKHANMAGTAPNGGVLAIAGDDHGAKSSTIAHQSEQAFVAAMMPVLAPSDLQELVEFGLVGFAMSRYSGCWVGMKVTTQLADSSGSIAGISARPTLRAPDVDDRPAGGLGIRWPENKQDMEARLVGPKLAAAKAFARANRVDRVVWNGQRSKLGLITVGKAHNDLLDALRIAGIDEDEAQALGLAVYKVGMPWPLEPEGVLAFANGLERILVIEEKRALVEPQLKALLYAQMPEGPRPLIIGKFDAAGQALLASHGELSPEDLVRALRELIPDLKAAPEHAPRQAPALPDLLVRKEFFCAGCPHNRSTQVPEGSVALAGIGCHTMASRMPDRHTATVCQMGGEGAAWIGQAPFVDRKHVFQNLGDGTYFHSGLLAIRAAIAARVNITYKILFNDAVAMTGGQPVDGVLGVEQICAELAAEGVKRIVIATDEPERPRRLPTGATVHPRQELDAIQRELRDVEGVSILIFEQVCAAEKRRRRKRKLLPEPPSRLFINERVCEGCGDCVKASSCIAVAPVDTPLGRKRAIDQSACNKDFSCVEGFCPSFVEVEGAQPRKADASRVRRWLADRPPLPQPARARIETTKRILITGIGGSGVVTIGAVVAMAAHLDGLECAVLDMTGLAQKNGAVASHLTLAARRDAIGAVKIGVGAADYLIACDAVVAAAPEHLKLSKRSGAAAVVNADVAPTAGVIFDLTARMNDGALIDRIASALGGDAVACCAATGLSRKLLGDAVFANMLMLGFAWQKSALPVSHESLATAIRLNGAAVETNLTAFELGRRLAHEGTTGMAELEIDTRPKPAAESAEVVDSRRRDFLVAYQNTTYAARYCDRVARIAAIDTALARVAADALFKLMAIKDEYEVARLYTDGVFRRTLDQEFTSVGRVRLHLAPPLLAPRDRATGHPRKIAFGPWIFPVLSILARFKRLRGTPLDPFGWTNERRTERRLLAEYEALLDELTPNLCAGPRDIATALLALPSEVRGFGHVKAAAIARHENEKTRLLALWREKISPGKLKGRVAEQMATV